MLWLLLIAALSLALPFCPARAKMCTIVRKWSFYAVIISLFGIKLYSAALFLRLKRKVSPELCMVTRGGYKVITNARISRTKKLKRKLSGKKPPNTAGAVRTIYVKKGCVDILIGAENAAATAYVCAVLQNAVRALLFNYGLGKIRVRTQPDFSKKTARVGINCIFYFIPVQIIFRYFLKKGGS